MTTNGMVPALLSGAGAARAVLFGVSRMLAHYQKRNDEAHAELRDAFKSADAAMKTRLAILVSEPME